MGFTLKSLEDVFMSAYRNKLPFVAIRVRTEGMKADRKICAAGLHEFINTKARRIVRIG